MRHILLVICLLAACVAARAQTTPAVDPPWVPDTTRLRPEAPITPDTAAALHRLFAAKRGMRAAIVVGTVLVGGVAFVINVTTGSKSTTLGATLADLGQKVGIVSLTSVAVLVELVAENKYSRSREQLAIESWRRHQLAPDIRQRLTPPYFEPDGYRRP